MIDYKNSIRSVKDFPIEGINFRDITGLLEDPEAFNKCLIDLTAEIMLFKGDVIVGIESRGFLFGTPLARDIEIPFVLARKPGKLPNKTVSKKYDLEYGKAELQIQLLSPINGKVIIIDDLIATGGTALACANLIHENWNIPKEDILILAVIDLPNLGGSAIIQDNGYNVRTLVEFDGE